MRVIFHLGKAPVNREGLGAVRIDHRARIGARIVWKSRTGSLRNLDGAVFKSRLL